MSDQTEEQFTDTLALSLIQLLPRARREPGQAVTVARLAVDVGTYFGFRVQPVATACIAMNDLTWGLSQQGITNWGEHPGAFSQIIRDPLLGTHLILKVGARRFIDPTIGRWAQPEQGVPLRDGGINGLLVSPFDRPGDVLTLTGIGCTVVYQRSADKYWARRPEWRRDANAQKMAGIAIKAMRA